MLPDVTRLFGNEKSSAFLASSPRRSPRPTEERLGDSLTKGGANRDTVWEAGEGRCEAVRGEGEPGSPRGDVKRRTGAKGGDGDNGRMKPPRLGEWRPQTVGEFSGEGMGGPSWPMASGGRGGSLPRWVQRQPCCAPNSGREPLLSGDSKRLWSPASSQSREERMRVTHWRFSWAWPRNDVLSFAHVTAVKPNSKRRGRMESIQL